MGALRAHPAAAQAPQELTHRAQAPQKLSHRVWAPLELPQRVHRQHRHPQTSPIRGMGGTGTPKACPPGGWAPQDHAQVAQDLIYQMHGQHWHPKNSPTGCLGLHGHRPPCSPVPWARVPTLPPAQHSPRGSAEPPSQPPAPAPRPSAAPAARPSPSPRSPAARRRRTGWRGCNSWCSAGSCRSRSQAGPAQLGGSGGRAASYLKTVRTSRAEMRVSSDSEYPTV